MLLVDDGEGEIAKDHVVLDQRMGADEQVDLAGFELRQQFPPLLALFAAGEDRDPHSRALGERGDGLDVLARQNFGRSEEHTSELQSRQYLVCRLLLEKKKIYIQ